jgi:MATE family multidrug resistance protein
MEGGTPAGVPQPRSAPSDPRLTPPSAEGRHPALPVLLDASYRQLWRIALPLMGSILVHQLVGVVDTRFMAELSTERSAPLAAVGLASLVFMMLSGIPMAFSTGGQIMVARRAGEGRTREVGELVDHALVHFIGVGLLLLAVLLLGLPPLLRTALASAEVARLTTTYLHWRAAELPVLGVYMAFNALFAGLGRTRVLFWSTLWMTGTNVVLDYALVFGRFGLPRMEIAGAGLASFLAAVVATAFLAWRAAEPAFRREHDLFRRRPWNGALVGRLNALSGPMVVQFMMGSGVWFYFFTRLERLGEDALAVSNVVKLLYMLLGTATWGLGNAVNTLVSNLMGQGRTDDVLVVLRRSLVLGTGLAALAAALLAAWPQGWLRLFTVERPDLVALGVEPLLVAAGALVWMAAAVAVFRTVTGVGATRWSLLAELSALQVYLLYVELVIGRWELGLGWAWASEFVYWTVTGLACAAYLRWGRWREIIV